MKTISCIVLSILAMTLSGCGKKQTEQTQQTELSGEVFIVTKSAESIKLGLVRVGVLSETEVLKHISARQAIAESLRPLVRINLESADAKYQKAKREADRLYNNLVNDPLYIQDDKDAVYLNKERNWRIAADRQQKLLPDLIAKSYTLNFLESARFFFAELPTPVIHTDTDSDGKYSIMLERGKRYAIVAKSERKIGDSDEEYNWMVWVRAIEEKQRLTLSNNNLMKSQHPDNVLMAKFEK